MNDSKCAEESSRIHENGQIQTCGFIIAVEEDDSCASRFKVLGVSGNIVEVPWISGSSIAELLGSDLEQLLGAESVETVRSLIGKYMSSNDHDSDSGKTSIHSFPRIYGELHLGAKMGDEDCVVTCSVSGNGPGIYLLEIEADRDTYEAVGDPMVGLLQMEELTGQIPVGATPQLSIAAMCDALMEIVPAYDRVLVYRFAADNSGEVIHESIRPGAEIHSSYLNLRFLGSDILPQTRDQLMKLQVGFIADTSAPGVPVSMAHDPAKTLDLSKSVLRVPPPCHLACLRNMGVKSSLVAAIIVDDKLWGLFACHCYTRTAHPSCEARVKVKIAAKIAASIIWHSEREQAASTSLSLLRTIGNLNNYTRVQDFLSAENQTLIDLLRVDSIVLCENARSVAIYGNKDVALTLEECMHLVDGNCADRSVMFKSLKERGVALFSVRSFILAFVRGNIARPVKWAGKPDPPPLDRDVDHPSTSFGLYTEQALTEFEPWSPPTVDLLGVIRHGVSSHLYAEALPADLQETLAHISHELRTPFHGVVGSLQMLEAGHTSMESDEKLDVVRAALRCGSSMLSTLDDILDIAKDRNNTEVARQRFKASSPILMAVAAMNPFAATESIGLTVDVGSPASALDLIGDERRIKGVVQNLVNNAIKFTPSGGAVRASLHAHDSLQEGINFWMQEAARFEANTWMGNPTSYCNVKVPGASNAVKWHMYCVEDSGVGILPADIPHLAAAYRQLSRGVTKSYAGTGLGLHICKAHVDAMSGCIGIASTISEGGSNGGTLFAVLLPMSLAELQDVEGMERESRENSIVTCCRLMGSRKLVFLVVDDQKINVKLMERKILEFFKGYGGDVEVATALDGAKALEVQAAVRGSKETVLAGIFMDFHMPKLDGIECTKIIRQQEAENGWPRITVCGCTADPTDMARKTFENAGGDDVLSKPWHPGQVESVCNDMITCLSESIDGEAA